MKKISLSLSPLGHSRPTPWGTSLLKGSLRRPQGALQLPGSLPTTDKEPKGEKRQPLAQSHIVRQGPHWEQRDSQPKAVHRPISLCSPSTVCTRPPPAPGTPGPWDSGTPGQERQEQGFIWVTRALLLVFRGHHRCPRGVWPVGEGNRKQPRGWGGAGVRAPGSPTAGGLCLGWGWGFCGDVKLSHAHPARPGADRQPSSPAGWKSEHAGLWEDVPVASAGRGSARETTSKAK